MINSCSLFFLPTPPCSHFQDPNRIIFIALCFAHLKLLLLAIFFYVFHFTFPLSILLFLYANFIFTQNIGKDDFQMNCLININLRVCFIGKWRKLRKEWDVTQFNLGNYYSYKLKFISTFKQKYNSKFREFETVRTLKIQKNDQMWIKKISQNKWLWETFFVSFS